MKEGDNPDASSTERGIRLGNPEFFLAVFIVALLGAMLGPADFRAIWLLLLIYGVAVAGALVSLCRWRRLSRERRLAAGILVCVAVLPILYGVLRLLRGASL